MAKSIETGHPAPGVRLLTISRPERFDAIDPATDREMALACTALLRHARCREQEESLALERRAFARLVMSREAQEAMRAFSGRRLAPDRDR